MPLYRTRCGAKAERLGAARDPRYAIAACRTCGTRVEAVGSPELARRIVAERLVVKRRAAHARRGDTLDDYYPGSGIVGRSWDWSQGRDPSRAARDDPSLRGPDDASRAAGYDGSVSIERLGTGRA